MIGVRFARRHLAGATALMSLTAFTLLYASAEPDTSPPSAADGTAPARDLVDRGEYLTAAGNCFSCHTTPEGAPYAGGVPFETPFGTIYSTNITPDVETGIGDWSREDLRRAMHEGIAADGSLLFPAFPYPSYTKVTDGDVDAIYAYLRTLKPVSYTPPVNDFLFNQRFAMALWNGLYFTEGRFVPDPAQSDEWNRGAYLVEGLGHCGACHTPRNRLMAEVTDRHLQGGVMLHEVAPGKVRPWYAVDLTSSKSGLASWSEQELTQYFQKGFSRRAGTFGPMNDIIVNSLMKLAPEDLKAMAVYLKSLPGREHEGETVPAALAETGAAIYEERCSECHEDSGRGGIFSAPPLAGSAIVQAENPASLINVIMYGPDVPDAVTFGAWETMDAYGDALNDAEIAAVSNYVRGSWDNVGRPVTVGDVVQQR